MTVLHLEPFENSLSELGFSIYKKVFFTVKPSQEGEFFRMVMKYFFRDSYFFPCIKILLKVSDPVFEKNLTWFNNLNRRCCFMWVFQVASATRSVVMQVELTVMLNLRWTAYTFCYIKHECNCHTYTLKLGFHYTGNATTTTQKQSDYKVEQSSFTLIALFWVEIGGCRGRNWLNGNQGLVVCRQKQGQKMQ